MKLLIVKQGNEIKYGSIKAISEYTGIHRNNFSRWINEGDRKVITKKGFEIYLNAEKL